MTTMKIENAIDIENLTNVVIIIDNENKKNIVFFYIFFNEEKNQYDLVYEDTNVVLCSENTIDQIMESLYLLGYETILLEEEQFRICSNCKKVIIEGFIVEGLLKYYCTKKCMYKHSDFITKENYTQLYKDDVVYYTNWFEF